MEKTTKDTDAVLTYSQEGKPVARIVEEAFLQFVKRELENQSEEGVR